MPNRIATLASMLLALAAQATAHAQSAVLVLTPAPTAVVRAGTGTRGFAGDNGPATAAQLAAPNAMAQDAAGNLYLADTGNHRIRRIAADGTVTTVAGTGQQGFSGDNAAATAAQLDSPGGIAIATAGTVYLADTRNHRIRSIDSKGVIHTVAGTGARGFSGDGQAATAAQFNAPTGLALGLSGDLYVTDTGNHRIRHIAADGTVATVAGDGVEGLSPDGTIDTAAISLRRPAGLALTAAGDLLIADTGNYRVAAVTSSGTGTLLGSGEQGALDTTVAPARSPLGATAAVVAGTASAPYDVSTLDRDRSQAVRVSLPSVTFPDTALATASATRTVALKNGGTAALTVTGLGSPETITTAATSTCAAAPFTLAAGTSCNLDLQFTPQAEGAVSGLLQVSVRDALPGRVLLSGNGVRTGTLLNSTTTLQTSGSIVYAGSPLQATAAVLGSSAALPSGTVTLLDGTAELGTATLNPSAQASFSTAALQAGSHALTARYSGNGTYRTSTSAVTTVTVVAQPDFTITMAAGSTRVSTQAGNAASVALTLQPVNGVLNRNVTATVDGLPAGSTVNVTPVPILLAGDPVTVTVAFKLPVSLTQSRPAPRRTTFNP